VVKAKKHKTYASVVKDDGGDYALIAATMTILGHKMNHVTARNNVIRILKKFASAYAGALGIKITAERADAIARSTSFQEGITSLLQEVECLSKVNDS
jgi:ApbE superfamily uncharacterized protein (UPF0280 family)